MANTRNGGRHFHPLTHAPSRAAGDVIASLISDTTRRLIAVFRHGRRRTATGRVATATTTGPAVPTTQLPLDVAINACSIQKYLHSRRREYKEEKKSFARRKESLMVGKAEDDGLVSRGPSITRLDVPWSMTSVFRGRGEDRRRSIYTFKHEGG